MAAVREATAMSDTNDSFMLVEGKRKLSRECMLSGVSRRGEGVDEYQHLLTSLFGGSSLFYSISLDTPGLDLTATTQLASAGAGYSGTVSRATKEAHPTHS